MGQDRIGQCLSWLPNPRSTCTSTKIQELQGVWPSVPKIYFKIENVNKYLKKKPTKLFEQPNTIVSIKEYRGIKMQRRKKWTYCPFRVHSLYGVVLCEHCTAY